MPGSSGVDWSFNAVDGITDPAHHMLDAIKAVEAAVKHLDENIAKSHEPAEKKTESAFGKMTESVKSFAEGFFYVTESIKTGAEMVEGVFDKLKEATEFVLDVSDFRRNALLGLDAMVNTGYEANVVLDKLEGWARQTGMKKDVFGELATGLLGAGFREVELKPLLGALSDVQGVNQGKIEASQQLMGLMEKIHTTGKIDERTMKEFGELHIKPELIYQALANAKHVSLAQAKALLATERGGKGATEDIQAILDAIHTGIDKGGKLGSMGEKWADGSIPAQIIKARDAFSGLFEGVDTTKFAGAIAHITAQLTGDEGERFAKAIGVAFDRVGSWLDKINFSNVGLEIDELADGLEQAADYGVDFFKGFSQGWRDVKPAIDLMGSAISGIVDPGSPSSSGVKMFAESIMNVVGAFIILGEIVVFVGEAIVWAVAGVAEGIFNLGAGVVTLFESVNHVMDSFYDGLVGAGMNLVEGLWTGIKSAWSGMLADFHALLDELPAAVKHVLGIASPSKVFAGLGMQTMEGFAGGMEAVNVRASAVRIIRGANDGALSAVPANDAGSMAPNAPNLGGAGGPRVIHLELKTPITVHGGGKDGHETASAMVSEMRRVLLPDLVSALEQLRLEVG